MSDDFLHKFREEPRPEFTESLYKQLNQEADDMMLSVSVPTLSINGRHTRSRSHTTNHSLALIAATFALVILGAILLYMANAGTPHPTILTQIDTEISLDDLPTITRENANRLVQIKQIGEGAVNQIVWSPDGKTLAAAGTLGVWLYDTSAWDTSPLLLMQSADIGAERQVTFSADGTLLAASDGAAIHIWDTSTWGLTLILEGHTNTVTALAFSPDSSTLASSSGDFGVADSEYTVRLWDTQSGAQQVVLTDTDGVIQSLAFSPDGALLAAACWCEDEKSRVWNLQSGERIQQLEHTGGAYAKQDLVFSPDGGSLAQGDRWGVNLWNTVTGEQIEQVKRTESVPLNLQDIVYSSDGGLLAFGSWNYGINVWDTQAKEFLPRSQEQQSLLEVDSLTFNPSGEQIATLTNGNLVQIWDTYSGEELAHIQDWTGQVRALISANGQSIVAHSTRGGVISVYDSANGTLRRQIDTGLSRIFYHGVALSSDNTTLAYVGWNASLLNTVPITTSTPISLTNISTGEIRSLGEDSKGGYLLAISPDGIHLASASPLTPTSVQIWDIADPEIPVSVFQTHLELDPPAIQTPNDIRYSPDGLYLVLEYVSGEMSVIRADTGEPVSEFRPPSDVDTTSGSFHDLLTAISPDGMRLVTMYNAPYDTPEDGAAIYIWDIESGELLNTFQASALGIADPIFSPDGRLLVLAMVNKTEILDAETGESLFLSDQSGLLSASSIAFDPDGRFIVTGGWDGIIRVWGVLPK